jgi:predicted AAA+ superfamily ATPase
MLLAMARHFTSLRLAESFVAGELLRQSSWTTHPVSLYHYRSQNGDEADIVLEDRAGRIAAVEVKLSASLSPRDGKGLASLKDACGDKFIRGTVIYTGSEAVPIGDRLFALPIGILRAN